MKSGRTTSFRGLVIAGLAVLATTPALFSQSPDDRVVQLPPMVIEESSSLPPWLYASADGVEYLSRCSESVTRDYVQMTRDRTAALHALFPAGLFLHMDVPVTTILVSQKLKPTSNVE